MKHKIETNNKCIKNKTSSFFKFLPTNLLTHLE